MESSPTGTQAPWQSQGRGSRNPTHFWGTEVTSPHFSPGDAIMAQDFRFQRVLVTEERSGHYVRGSMCALKGKRQARARPERV